MAYQLTETERYRSARVALSANARVALSHVERAIADDPIHRVRRHQRADGVVIDYSAQGLFVAFRLRAHNLIELVEVIDLKNA